MGKITYPEGEKEKTTKIIKASVPVYNERGEIVNSVDGEIPAPSETSSEQKQNEKKRGFSTNLDFLVPYKDIRIGDYMEVKSLHDKFFEGRHTVRPHFRPGSSMERAWYDEQADRCINGFTHRGKFMNPLYYFFLNFMIFEVITTDKNGKVTGVSIGYPLNSRIDEYVFDIMWQAKKGGWHVSLMGGRGLGKSFFFTSVLLREYMFFEESVGFVTATNENLAGPAWDKVFDTLGRIERFHPGFKHKRIVSTQKEIKSGYIISDEHGDTLNGYKSQMRKIVYGKDAGVTRGTRPNVQLIEEFAAFAGEGKKGSLKEVFMQSRGSWVINGMIRKAFVMLSGTGGSVENDEAMDLFINPERYDIYPIHDWGGSTGIFIPVQYKTGGTWEKTGVPDLEEALIVDERYRERLKDDPVDYQNRLQEYPRTIEEVFKRNGSNIFNQTLLANQWAYLMFEANEDGEKENQFVKRGSMVWKKNPDTNVIEGVEFVHDNVGDIYITEEVELDEQGNHYDDLYVMGVDSIDQGDVDSSSTVREHSKLGLMVKKRFIEGKMMSSTSNVYVCYYNKRSHHVEEDFDNVLKISWYYNARINLEYTKIGILGHFNQRKQNWRFMARPVLNRPASKDPSKGTNQIGTTAATNIIKHGDGKIKEYVDSFSKQIMFIPLIDQLKSYDADNRTKFDLVVAMNMTEVADDDLGGKAATVEDENEYQFNSDIGYYRDENGKRRYGVIPNNPSDVFKSKATNSIMFYDEAGVPRFDSNFTDDTRESIITPEELK